MTNNDYRNLSADMRRIAWWLQKGNTVLADDFLKLTVAKFGNDESRIEGRSLAEWLKRVADYKRRGWKSAEDALTLSILLKHRFFAGV